MFATGICLILNYDVFDEAVLSPDMRTEDGKRTIGIILTVCGLLAIFVSVLVSLLYLCNRPKSGQVNPDDLSRIPTTARNGKLTPDGRGSIRKSTDSRSTSNQLTDGMNVQQRGPGVARPNIRPAPPITGSTEVKVPRYKKRHRHKHKFPRQSRLEEIKEADAISRKTLEGAVLSAEDNSTPRSGSFSSEQTLDDSRRPTIVINQDYNGDYRPPSGGSTSVTSDTSIYRTLENDKSRRELQFLPEGTVKDHAFERSSKDSLFQDDSSVIVVYNNALKNDNVNIREHDASDMSEDRYSAGGTSELSQQQDSSASSSQVLPESNLVESDGSTSLSSYTPQHGSETRNAKLDRLMSSEIGGVVNETFIPDDNDIHIPGQSDATSEEGDELSSAQYWQSDHTRKQDLVYDR